MLLLGEGKTSFTPWQAARFLLVFFCLWKFILLFIVALAPGPGYDTSTSLLVDAETRDISTANVGEVPDTLAWVLKLVRWDAIYYSHIVQRGYVFEQEYAFASGFPSLVAFVQKGDSHSI